MLAEGEEGDSAEVDGADAEAEEDAREKSPREALEEAYWDDPSAVWDIRDKVRNDGTVK